MLRRLYDWTISLAEHPRALWVLAIVAFIESSVFPIPPDVLMIPMILARPSRAWVIAGVALVASVLGGRADSRTLGRKVGRMHGRSGGRAGGWAVERAGSRSGGRAVARRDGRTGTLPNASNK